jgi:hypothetical protein
VIVLLLLLLIASRLESRTWFIKVDGSGDAPTIQAGVDSAASGDTVLAGPGVFADTASVPVNGSNAVVCVNLSKDIVLMGSGPENTTIGSPDANVAVYVDQVGPTGAIRDLKITTESGAFGCVGLARIQLPSAGTAIVCQSASLEISGNEIYENGVGIHLIGSPVHFHDNRVHLDAQAMLIEMASNAVVERNSIHDCGMLVDCTGSSPTFLENDMGEACDGLFFAGDCSPIIMGNHIHDIASYEPTAIYSRSGATIENNRIESVWRGVYLWDAWPETRIVRGNVFYETVVAVDIRRPNVVVENNTFDRSITAIMGAAGSTYHIRRNIITQVGYGIFADPGDPPVIECNDIFSASDARYGGIPDQTGVNGNISVDPEFCGIDDSGNYFLQSDSPCAPGNHPDGYDCGLTGARPVNCGTVGAERRSWGSIKAKYRTDRHD